MENMRICGIELKGKEAIITIIEGRINNFKHIDCMPKKIPLVDDESQDQVKSFKDTLVAFVRHHKVEKIVIKKRSKKGNYSGGPISFKLEGLIQLIEDCSVELRSANTISAKFKKHNPSIPQTINKYQENSFKTAFTELN